MPFVLFGLLKAYITYKKGRLSQLSTLLRIGFWAVIAFGLIFAQNVYDFLRSNELTSSPPLSLADVILVTGVIFCLFLNVRLYSKLERSQRQITELNENLALLLGEGQKNNKGK